MILRDYLKRRYAEIRAHHDRGATGEEVTAALNDLTDEVINRVYRDVLGEFPRDSVWRVEDGVAVAALGGYGRGERSPYSDVDIMFLFRPSIRTEVEKVSSGVLQKLWDAGFEVGHSTRTIQDCIEIGRKDLTVKTALMEARFLDGSRDLFDRFRSRFHRKVVLQNPGRYAREKIKGREVSWERFGTTTYLLEPNIKKSRGGLREIHLLQWLSLIWNQTSSLETMKRRGLLARDDYLKLRDGREFLWRIRNEMHFHSGQAQDTLSFDDQVRLAEKWGYRDQGHLLAVEQFMRRYYDHTTAIAEISGRYISGMVREGFLPRLRSLLFRKNLGQGMAVTGDELNIQPEARAEIFSSGEKVLALFHKAQVHHVSLSLDLQNQLMLKMADWPKEFFSGPEARNTFFAILAASHGVARTLRLLHRYRILEGLLPGLERVRTLMQFNQYHKYTVDEHSLRAVEEAEKLSSSEGVVGLAHREIADKPVLYLALLSHDLGKGMVAGEHSEQGAEIARETAQTLGLSPEASERLVFLVREHLAMTHVAFRRDIADSGVLAQFAETVGDMETLRLLYVLTLADITAVGPGMLTAWKRDLLLELFLKTSKILSGDRSVITEDERVEKAKEAVLALSAEGLDGAWLKKRLEVIPRRYLLATPVVKIKTDLLRLEELKSDPGNKKVLVFAENDAKSGLTEYSVYAVDHVIPGFFYKITSVLAAKRLQTIGAEIHTWRDGSLVDRFKVSDPDFKGLPGSFRLDDVREEISRVLESDILPDLTASLSRYQAAGSGFPVSNPVRVEIDNTTSENYTVVEVFATDRPGLLAAMAEALFTARVSVQAARVATQLDQVVDVFHVTDEAGQRILDPDRIRAFKSILTDQIERFLSTARVQ